MPVDLNKFLAFYHRLRKRRFFRKTAYGFEGHPRYFDAIEWVFDQKTRSLTLAFRPGHTAARIALAYFLCREEDRWDPALPPTPDGLLDHIIVRWWNPNKPDEDQDFLAFWDGAKKRLIAYDPANAALVSVIAGLVMNDQGLDDLDRKLTLFSIGLFFTLILESQECVDQEIQNLIDTTVPSREAS